MIKGLCIGKQYDIASISVFNNENMDQLIKKIHGLLPRLFVMHIQLPYTDETQSLISWMHEYAEFEKITYGSTVDMVLTTHEKIKDKIVTQVKLLNGDILSINKFV